MVAPRLGTSTVVFFASDNGASNEGNHNYEVFKSSGPLKGYKRSLHEGGHRSPLVVRWTGQVAAGARSQQQFAFYDFFATALDLAGTRKCYRVGHNVAHLLYFYALD